MGELSLPLLRCVFSVAWTLGSVDTVTHDKILSTDKELCCRNRLFPFFFTIDLNVIKDMEGGHGMGKDRWGFCSLLITRKTLCQHQFLLYGG